MSPCLLVLEHLHKSRAVKAESCQLSQGKQDLHDVGRVSHSTVKRLEFCLLGSFQVRRVLSRVWSLEMLSLVLVVHFLKDVDLADFSVVGFAHEVESPIREVLLPLTSSIELVSDFSQVLPVLQILSHHP